VITGGGLALWSAAFGAFALDIAIGSEAEFKTFAAWLAAAVLLGLMLCFANWTYGIYSLVYEVQHDALVIRWGFRRVVVPIDTILRIVPGRTVDLPRVTGLNWWGCHIGHAEVKRLGYTLFYSTHREPDELVYVHTTQESYALSVVDQASFAEELQSRAAVAPIEAHPQRSDATGIAAIPFWRDRVAVMAAALAALACAVLCGYVFARYPDLADVVQLNFPEFGGAVRVGDKSELLKIAYAGIGVLVVNLAVGVAAHARERAAGLWLIASGGLIQFVLLIAALAAFAKA
jgi:hypothetical protein